VAYRVSLTLASGQRTQLTELQYETTPNVGDSITVGLIGRGMASARVTSVCKMSSNGKAGQTVDVVDAQEL
jgi:hypothetical protein